MIAFFQSLQLIVSPQQITVQITVDLLRKMFLMIVILIIKTITSGIFLLQMSFHNACTCNNEKNIFTINILTYLHKFDYIVFYSLICTPSVILIFFSKIVSSFQYLVMHAFLSMTLTFSIIPQGQGAKVYKQSLWGKVRGPQLRK